MKNRWPICLVLFLFSLAISAVAQTNGSPNLPIVSIQATDSSASEAGSGTGTFTLYRYGDTNSNLTVTYSIGGTASNGVDYVTLPGSVVIPAGATNTTILVQPIDDNVPEPTEYVMLTLKGSNASSYQVSTVSNAVVYIYDNDDQPPTVAMLSPTNGASFSGPTNILLQAQAQDADGTIGHVGFYNGTVLLGNVATATNGVYSLLTSLTNFGSFTLTARAYDNFEIGATSAPVVISVAHDSNQTPMVSLRVTDSSASRPTGDTAAFSVSRFGNTNSDVTVYYSIGGTASNGIDYVTLPGNVVVHAGATSATVLIQPIEGSVAKPQESVILTLIPVPGTAGSSYQISTANSGTVYIQDTNRAPIVTVLSPADDAVFTAPTNILLQAQATDPDGTVQEVYFYSGTNYIVRGITNGVSNVYSLVWSNVLPGNYSITARAIDNFQKFGTSAPVNISVVWNSNQPPTVNIQATDSTASEPGADTGTFSVGRYGDTTSPLTVYYSVKGTASSGVDYVALPGSITIPAGATNALITVQPIDDSIPELTEYVTLSLISNPASNSAYQIGTYSNATVNIYDNDVNQPPTVTLLSPTNGASFTYPASILLQAQAQDADGTISFVNFYYGSNYIGHATNAVNSVYSMLWTNAPVGNFTLIVRAADNLDVYGTSAPVNISVSAPTNQNAVVSIQATDPTASEPGTDTGTFSVNRYGATTSSLTVYYSVKGTASNGVDYVALPGSVTIPSGATNALITVQPIDDNVPESTEYVMLTLIGSPNSTIPAYQIGSPSNATVYIYDNDTNHVPTVALLSPTNGASYVAPTNILLQAQAQDADGSILFVNFYYGSNFIGHVTNAISNVYSMVWSNVPAGAYSLIVRAADNLDTYGTSAPVNITVTSPTNIPPVVSILYPTNGAVFSPLTNVLIYASASDADGGVQTVEFFANDRSLGIATNRSASGTSSNIFSLTWTNPPSGSYALTAKATDNGGAQTVSAPVNIFVPIIDPATNVPPSVHISSPTNGTALFAPASTYIYASASDPDDTVSTVEFFVNGVSIGITTNQPSSANLVNPFHVFWSNVPAGTYALTAKATDSRGAATTSEAVTVTVKPTNVPPVITITSPTNGSLFYGPTNISVTADASDADGAVTVVTFYSGTRLLGVCSNAPYNVLWTNVSPGTYQLIARAGDNGGKAGYSSPVNITVRSVNELSFAQRTLPMWYVAGVKLQVKIQASPRTNTASYSLTDTVPAGWVIGSAGTNATVDPAGQSVMFGPFNDHLARTFVYEVTPPANAIGEKHFSGSCTADGVTGPILGMSSIVPVPPHPADNNPTNFVIGLDELTAYVTAWQQDTKWPISPSPVPISYVTRAGYLLQNGGYYGISTAYPTPFPPLLWVLTNKIVSQQSLSSPTPWTTNNYGSAIASMPTNYSIRIPITVTINVTPYPSVSAYAVEDRPPEGWIVSNVSEGGVYSSITKKVKWGLFTDSTARTLSYQVTPTTNFVNAAEFAGVMSSDGVNVPITGVRRTYLWNGILPPARLQSITTLTNGDRIITFIGTPGVAYLLEGSADLSTWTPMDQLLNNDGVLNYTDLAGTNFVNRFYRAVPMDGN